MAEVGVLKVGPDGLEPHQPGRRTAFETIALLLQGGGALGAYQCGAYQALAEADLQPDWIAGISIGSVNAALIAGNPPAKRVEKLREFWEEITVPIRGPFGMQIPWIERFAPSSQDMTNQMHALSGVLFGVPHFFTPRMPPPYLFPPASSKTLSYYDTGPLKAALERLVDFDRINAGDMRFSVGATNMRSGQQIYFDNTTHRIGPEHVMASGSLPPGLPPQEIDGELYWDGGLVSNTPLSWVLDSTPRRDTLAFQIDVWSARGPLPRDFIHAALREKEIRFASRTQVLTEEFKAAQKLRVAVAQILKELPDDLRERPEVKTAAEQVNEKVFNIVHLIYHSKSYEGFCADFEFSRASMEAHWQAGHRDAVRSLSQPEILQRPDKLEGVRTFDWCKTEPDT
jgi:NTE family protein